MKIDGGVSQVPVQQNVQPKQVENSEKKVAEQLPKETAVSSDTGFNIDVKA